jgi:hypothetical protein
MSSSDAAEADSILSIPKKTANVTIETDEEVKDDGTRITTNTTTVKQNHAQGETTVKQKDTKTVEAEIEIEETIYDCLCCCPFLRRFERDARAKSSSGNNASSGRNTSA